MLRSTIRTSRLLLAAMVVLTTLACSFARATTPEPADPDGYDIMLLPTEDFPFQNAAQLAAVLANDTGLKIRAALPLGTNDWRPLPDSRQFDPAALKDLAQPAIADLKKTYGASFHILLTTRDINNAGGGLRFVFAESYPKDKISVISVARLLMGPDGKPASTETVITRLRKMVLRTIGLQYFEKPRSADPRDLLYSPLMSLDALDALELDRSRMAFSAPFATRRIVLLQPDFVLRERMGPDGAQPLGNYLKAIQAASKRTLALEQAHSSSGYIVLAVRDGASKVWLDFSPALPSAMEGRLRTALESVTPFNADKGVIVVAISASLWGAPAMERRPMPAEWNKVLAEGSGISEVGALVDMLWPPKAPSLDKRAADLGKSMSARVSADLIAFRELEFVCPLGGEKFKEVRAASAALVGRFLDKRPDTVVPWQPIARCPGNGFVLFASKFSPEELRKLEPVVASADYQGLRAKETNHFLAAHLLQALNAPDREIAFALLQASGETRDAEQQRRYLEDALSHYRRSLATLYREAGAWVDDQLIAGDLERRLGQFPQAESRFTALLADARTSEEIDRRIAHFQLQLVGQRDTRMHHVPARTSSSNATAQP